MDDEFKAVVMFLAVLLFFMGFVLTDYGASMRVSGNGHGESLMFSEIPPRVVYHLGLLSEVIAFFLLYSVTISYFADFSPPDQYAYRFDQSR